MCFVTNKILFRLDFVLIICSVVVNFFVTTPWSCDVYCSLSTYNLALIRILCASLPQFIALVDFLGFVHKRSYRLALLKMFYASLRRFVPLV